MDLVPRIYHETQESDSQMCGQHALNNLLQSRYFQPTDMADIAIQLDQEENDTLDEDRKISMNMDDSGFFSVQVLDRCLQVFNLSLDRWRSEDNSIQWEKPEEEEAFILNLASHWFCLRRFGKKPERWYNLNSFFPTPQWISGTYLSMVIKSAEDEGYSVFVIRPLTPQSSASLAAGDSILPNTSADEVAARLVPSNRETNASSTSFKGTGQTLGVVSGGDGGSGFSGVATGDFEDEDAAFQRALAASMLDSGSSSSAPSSAAPPAIEDPVALSLARSQARLQAFQREQAAALRGDYDMLDAYGGGAGGTGGFERYAAAFASGSGGGLDSQGTSRSGNVPQVDEQTEAAASGSSSRRPRRQGDPTALDDNGPSFSSASSAGASGSGSRLVAALPNRQRSRHDEDEEQMRLAIEASMREAKQRERAEAREARKAMQVDGDDDEDEDEEEEEDVDEEIAEDKDDEEVEVVSFPPSPNPQAQRALPQPSPPPAHPSFLGDNFEDDLDQDFGGHQQAFGADRFYDDEDPELQAALKASLEGVPQRWMSPPPKVAPPKPVVPPPTSVAAAAALSSSSRGSPSASAPPAAAVTSEMGDDGEEDEEEEQEEVLSPEEIRRRRLERFA